MLLRCHIRIDPAPIKDYKEVHSGFRLSVHTPWLGWRPFRGSRAKITIADTFWLSGSFAIPLCNPLVPD